MIVKPFKFFLFSILSLAFVVLFINLSLWQWERAKEKEAISQRIEKTKELPTLTGGAVFSATPNLIYQKVCIKGTFDNQKALYRDNQFFKRQLGYELYVAFNAEVFDGLILVNRGFVPRGLDYQTLPPFQDVTGSVTLCGQLMAPPTKEVVLKKEQTDNAWPKRVQSMAYHTSAKLFDKPLYSYYLQLDKESPYSFAQRDKRVTMTAAKHRGYAVQWGFLATLVVLMYGVFFMKTKHASSG